MSYLFWSYWFYLIEFTDFLALELCISLTAPWLIPQDRKIPSWFCLSWQVAQASKYDGLQWISATVFKFCRNMTEKNCQNCQNIFGWRWMSEGRVSLLPSLLPLPPHSSLFLSARRQTCKMIHHNYEICLHSPSWGLKWIHSLSMLLP